MVENVKFTYIFPNYTPTLNYNLKSTSYLLIIMQIKYEHIIKLKIQLYSQKENAL